MDDRSIAVAGRYDDHELGKPWTIVLYVDERCTPEQHDMLVDLFLKRLDFSAKLENVLAVRSAAVTLDHTPDAERIEVAPYITVRTRESVDHDEVVSCGIPGHDRPGREVIADQNRVQDGDFVWEYRGRTGFAANFAYAAERIGPPGYESDGRPTQRSSRPVAVRIATATAAPSRRPYAQLPRRHHGTG